MFGNNPTLRFPGNLMQVRSINELRGVSPYEMNDEAAILVTGSGLFTFDASSMANDNGVSVIRPDGFTPLQSGRWVQPVVSGDFATPESVQLVADSVAAQQAVITAQTTKLARTVYVTDAPYNVTATMTPADQSAGIMACIDANKGGTVIIPAGLGLTYSGIILTGPTYNGTRIIVEDDSIFRANPNPANGNFQTTTYCMFVFHDCDGCSLAITGSLNGNRLNQSASQQQPLIMIAGATNFVLNDGWTVREVRGDGVTILKKTLADASSKNSDTIYIGSGVGTNSVDDGRNLVSLISGSNITIGACTSINIGGIINGERMPGGWDCEPDPGAGHYVSNVVKGLWLVRTIGTSGAAWIGASQSGNDAARDWNIVDVHDAGSIVIHTDMSGIIGGPIIRRVQRARITADLRRSSRNAGIEVDAVDYCDLNLTAYGCSSGVTLGFNNLVVDSDIRITVPDHSASAVISVGVQRCNVQIRARNPKGAGTYGLNISVAERGTMVQTGVRYTLDCPNDANLSFAVRNGGVVFGPGTLMVGGSLLGYTGYEKQITSIDANIIPTENIQGRNYASDIPTNGIWANGDFVHRIGIAAAGSPGWYNTTSGTPTFKAAAVIAA